MPELNHANTNPNVAAPMSLRVRHDQTAAVFAGQFIVNSAEEDVIVDFASGPVMESGVAVLPVHTRIAMTRGGAQRLSGLLARVIENNRRNSQAAAATAALPGSTAANATAPNSKGPNVKTPNSAATGTAVPPPIPEAARLASLSGIENIAGVGNLSG